MLTDYYFVLVCFSIIMDPEKIDNTNITVGVYSIYAIMPKTVQKSDTKQFKLINLDDVIDTANVITPKYIINVDVQVDTKKRKLKSII